MPISARELRETSLKYNDKLMFRTSQMYQYGGFIVHTYVQYTQSESDYLYPRQSESGRVDPSWLIRVVTL